MFRLLETQRKDKFEVARGPKKEAVQIFSVATFPIYPTRS
jgi:hypothetical protein